MPYSTVVLWLSAPEKMRVLNAGSDIGRKIYLINSLRSYKYLTTLSKFGLVRSIGGLTFSPM